jgi:hypothetical protein
MERRYPQRKGKEKKWNNNKSTTNRLLFSKALRSSIDHGGQKEIIDFCFSCESKVHDRLLPFFIFRSHFRILHQKIRGGRKEQ